METPMIDRGAEIMGLRVAVAFHRPTGLRMTIRRERNVAVRWANNVVRRLLRPATRERLLGLVKRLLGDGKEVLFREHGGALRQECAREP